jgi:cell division initiation protein
MPITPLDLRKKSFGKVTFKGVDEKEVKNFLEQVAKDMEAIWKERTLLAEKVDELSARLEGFTRTEKAFQEAFVTAQQVCKDLKVNADREAQNIRDKAKLEASRIVREADEEAKTLSEELKELRVRRLASLGEIRGILDSFGKLIDHWESQDKAKSAK